ncbi:hypothetical protein OEG84_18720 [Hoeflea sp. G2-23]|uniref:Uncharacterized protein n=1 Tax=Hoeflea algicola TaxID=2983763 RepID=A0ABT3ZD03_9HYPH|nr:hypothetical protein [Hoeflea algicola]MCY0149685.1 hypothetical protein [Hoeflea algicola]
MTSTTPPKLAMITGVTVRVHTALRIVRHAGPCLGKSMSVNEASS